MNIVFDRETKIVGLGLTQKEAYDSMRFYVERSGRLSPERLERRKEIHAWLPHPNLLYVTGIGAILYEKNYFTNLVTGRKVRVYVKPLAHYLCLYSAFDGKLSFQDFTVTIAQEVNRFLSNISDKFLTLNDFPYINPVENLKIKSYHKTNIGDVSIIETQNDTLVIMSGGVAKEVDRTIGVDTDCLLAYLFASRGFTYDGKELKECEQK